MDPEAGTPAGGAPPQRRAFPRVPLRAKARMEFAEQRCFLSEWAVNLSPGGMFVRSEAPMAAGQRFDFEASLTPKGPRFEGVGEVMWVRRDWEGNARPPGFAVRFLELEDDGREMMQRLADVFLTRGVGAMQEELQAMTAAWQRRQLDEESTDEIHPVHDSGPLPDTLVVQAPWAIGAADEKPASKPEASDAAAAEPQASPGGERTVTPPLAAEEPAPEPPAAGSPAPQPGRRRVWWVGVLALALLGSGYVVMRGPLAGRAAPPRTDETATAVLPAPPPAPAAASVAMPANVLADPPAATFAGLADVKTEAHGDDLWVVLTLDGELPAQALAHWRPNEDPPREVIQLLGARRGYAPALIPVSSPLLAQIRVGFHPGEAAGIENAGNGGVDHADAGELRVVLDLASAAVVASPPARDGRSVRVRLTRAEAAPAAAPASPLAAPQPAAGAPAAVRPTTATATASPSIASQ
ncbi:MAG TPA: PilZ domain-containing protein [Thermoanaerobaculia bacterium]|nr:PilZ domain-containing protein [Thermoanaerobaculia bacterium]